MNLKEGQIYQGEVSTSGEAGPIRHWIVVAPFGKVHAHSIDNPLDLYCLPAGMTVKAIHDGRLHLVGEAPRHPVLQLQRDKEKWGIHDAHLGLHGETMDKMLQLLEHAVKCHYAYAPYAAAEIMTLINSPRYDAAGLKRIVKRVHELVHLSRITGAAAHAPASD